MSDREGSQNGDVPRADYQPEKQADRTLLGVPAPRVETSADSPQRSPVFVRSGTSVADIEPPPLPRMALPSRPPRAELPALLSEAPPAFTTDSLVAGGDGALAGLFAFARRYPALGMVGVPVLLASLLVVPLALSSRGRAKVEVAPSALGAPAVAAAPAPAAAPEAPSQNASVAVLADLEAKPLVSLSSSQLLQLADARAAREREAAKALRTKVAAGPALLQDKAIQSQLLRLAADATTAPEALATLAAATGPAGADLLYEAWTGTTAKTDATELARSLVFSPDVRPKASPALAVALALRSNETCEQAKATLPQALKDGDRRSLHLLVKLGAKRGCGPKKADDCFACLRDDPQELTATINAVKSRRAPSYPTP